MFAHMPIIRDIIYGAASRGAQLHALCEEIDVSVDQLSDSEIKVDFDRACKAWEHSVHLTKDNLLGLHVGESSTTSILGMVGNLMQSSPDLLSAFKTITQYSSVATDMFSYEIKTTGNQVTLTYAPARLWVNTSPQSARHATEQAMAGTLHVFGLLSGKKIKPLQVTFRHKRGGDLAEYARVFDSNPRFNSPANELIFQKQLLLTRVISHDRSLFVVFEKMLRDKKYKRMENLTDQIRGILLSDFQGQIPSLEVIAANLHLTPRTVQRKLSVEGTTFRNLVAGIQKELTTRFMEVKGANLSQIASLLGYSDASAFRRARRKWVIKK
jgi:AraC-like DNA-binding protein